MISNYLKKLGYNTVSDNFYTYIDQWLDWYKGTVDEFHFYTQYNGISISQRRRFSLGMAKKVCEDWANLLLNEKVEFSASNDTVKSRLDEILNENNFRVKGNQLIELTFALGTGAFVEYIENKKIKIDYIYAPLIYPIEWSNGVITQCAFGSEKVINGKKCIYLQIHVLEKGKYVIKNRLFDSETEREINLPHGIERDYHTKSSSPLFQIITPNIANNIDINCPMGVSIYANGIDVMKGIDLVYDSYLNEFRLGKKRILVPATMAQIKFKDTGLQPLFDPNDTEFYALSGMDNFEKPYEIDMNLRCDEHTEGLQRNLDLLSDKCGFGNNRYHFESGDLKTATEVISERSDMFVNLKKHELILRKALCDMLRAVMLLDGKTPDKNIGVDFDDSIIQDTDAEFVKNMQLVSSGVMPKYEFRMWWFNETEEEAKAKVQNEFDGAGEE